MEFDNRLALAGACSEKASGYTKYSPWVTKKTAHH